MSTPAIGSSTVPKPPPQASVPSALQGQQEATKPDQGGESASKESALGAGGPGASGANAADGNEAARVPVTAVAMKLLDVRLKPSSAILGSVLGEFTEACVRSKLQQIVVARTGGVLELYGIHHGASAGAGGSVLRLEQRIETRSILRDLASVRLVGEKRDVLALSSDSGCLGLVDFDKTHGRGDGSGVLVTPPFGKTGCRRSTPGQHLATDPKGRAICISATEKRKLVYVLNQQGGGEGGSGGSTMALASPLEAHRARTLCIATVGVDNGYDNPLFACLEVQYPEDDGDRRHAGTKPPQKQLAYYELDLGLNHVSRKWAVAVDSTAYSLAALPGCADGGPSGVLVGSEDTVSWYHNQGDASGNGKAGAGVSCRLPKRAWDASKPDTKMLVTQLTVHKQKRNKFFGLCQTEVGDVFKIDFGLSDGSGDEGEDPRVVSLTVALLDTLPPSNALNVSKKGLLFCPTEFGGTTDHGLYQFERIDLPDAPTETSRSGGVDDQATTDVATFVPSHKLKNLIKIDGLDNLSPTTGLLVGELTGGQEVSPQIYALGGRGPTACLRTLRHGCSVTELAVSELPGVPGAIFTVDDLSSSTGEETHTRPSKYIVVSFADATLVLSVGDTVEEVGRESGFTTNSPTLACTALKDGSCCQIHTQGVRHIQSGKALEWHVPGLNKVECASANQTQVMVALAGGEIIYFELDSQNGKLAQGPKRRMKADVCCLDVGVVEAGRERSLFCAIGCRDSTVQIVSLEPGPDKLLTVLGLTTLQSRPNSVRLLPSLEKGGDLVLMVGLDDGSSLRATVDPITGAIGTSPTRRFLGARPVSVARIPIDGKDSLLLLSSRPWISRAVSSSPGSTSGTGKHAMAPLSYTPLDHGCAFSSEAVPEGVVATSGKTLRILSIDASGLDGNDDEAFHANKVSLRYTPRQMTLLSTTTATTAAPSTEQQRKVVLAVVESDYNDYGLEEKTSMGFDPTGKKSSKSQGGDGTEAAKKGGDDDDAMDMDVDSDEEEEKKPEDQDGKDKEQEEDDDEDEEDDDEAAARATPVRGPIPPGGTSWGSCVRLVDPSNSCESLDCVEMGRNEAALCCASVRFHTRGGESLLAVGTVTGMTMHPLKQASSHVILYRIVDGERLQLLHKTTMNSAEGDGPVLAMAHFQGRLLVGIGRTLRLYEMGKRQLLRKCELKGLPTFVKTLQTAGDRAYLGDMMRSLHIVRYEAQANRLVLVANDPSPRPVVCQELLDFDTVAVGDKFGNVSVLRLPRGTDTATVDPTGGQRALWETSTRAGAPRGGNGASRLETLCQYHVGEVVTSLTRSSLVAGVEESLIYSTVTGRIGALVPFRSREDVEFYSQLEEHLRSEAPRPTGRDPQAYRSYYAPVMHVIDGELCDSFLHALSPEKQARIAEKLDRTVGEIMKKLEDTRNSLL